MLNYTHIGPARGAKNVLFSLNVLEPGSYTLHIFVQSFFDVSSNLEFCLLTFPYFVITEERNYSV